MSAAADLDVVAIVQPEQGLATDELLAQFIDDAATTLPALRGYRTSAEVITDSTQLDLEEQIAALETIANNAEKLLKANGYRINWDHGGYVIYRGA